MVGKPYLKVHTVAQKDDNKYTREISYTVCMVIRTEKKAYCHCRKSYSLQDAYDEAYAYLIHRILKEEIQYANCVL